MAPYPDSANRKSYERKRWIFDHFLAKNKQVGVVNDEKRRIFHVDTAVVTPSKREAIAKPVDEPKPKKTRAAAPVENVAAAAAAVNAMEIEKVGIQPETEPHEVSE